jgi:predicted PhzF superfamily epimerase YddE/YHI9
MRRSAGRARRRLRKPSIWRATPAEGTSGRVDLYARVFAPAAGVPEDPGSGSAAGRIGLFARQLSDTDEVATSQHQRGTTLVSEK